MQTVQFAGYYALLSVNGTDLRKRSYQLGVIVVLTAMILCIPARTFGQDLVKSSIPTKWMDRFLPEKLPKMDLPDYVKNDPLLKARSEAFAGRYKQALLTLNKVKDAAGDKQVEVALIRWTALAPLGRLDEALNALSQPAIADNVPVAVARARLLADMGKPDQAIPLLEDIIQKHPDSIAGHYWLAFVCEDIGKLDDARKAYEFFPPFIDKWKGPGINAFENAEEVTLIGRGLDRWATLNMKYKGDRTLDNTILTMFMKAYDHIDRGYWPAHVAATEYRLSHDDKKEAQKELGAAYKGNPQDIGTLAIAASMALAEFNFDNCDKVVALIRAVDSNSMVADLLDARSYLHQRRPKDAEPFIRRVLARRPRNIEAIGLLAAAEALQLHDDKTAELLREVDTIDPNNASAYLDVAEQLGAMRQYPRAALMYKKVIDRAPWWTAGYNGLGLLYTQSGDEDEASTGSKQDNAFAVLSAARELDPYNHRTTNYMRLLDDLQKFDRKETEHFVIMYDAKQDPIIPEYFGDYLESIFAEVCADYHCTPPVKTFIEVFPTHDAFSVRTTGSPWIGTVGASTGRVIALDPPRKGDSTMGTFNWAQVLRHEFTHTVTLAATDNRIAHWMTEGLAVEEEHSPLRWEWIPMLYNAVTHKQLFTMENLTWAFVRPKKPADRQLAYAESYWICTYIDQRWGHELVLKMLEEFRHGKSQDDVFPIILGVSISQFESDFFAWTEKQVSGWGYDADSNRKYDSLKDKGEMQIKGRQWAEALKTFEEIANIRPVDALPHTRLAALYMETNQNDKAIQQLIALNNVELKDNRYAKKIARIYRDAGDFANAVKYGINAVYIDPYDISAHELLAGLYEKSGDATGLEREKRVIPVLHAWTEQNAQRVAIPSEAPSAPVIK